MGLFDSKRPKSALMRDRAYKSNEPHEQSYVRKTRPKNPRYMADGGMVRDEIRKFVIPYLKDEHNIEVDKSLNNGFNWFVPAISDELPDDFDDLSEKEQQEFGTHLATDKELIDFARELGYITDEEVFGEYADGGMMAKGGEIKVGSKIGFLNPKNGRYKFSEVLEIDGDTVKLVERHPTRRQWDNFFTESIERLNKFSKEDSEDFKDGRKLIKIMADGGMMAKGGKLKQKFEYVNWQDISDDPKDNNKGFIYGINLIDEESGEVVDVEWFKTESLRDKAIKKYDLEEYEFESEMADGGMMAKGGKVESLNKNKK